MKIRRIVFGSATVLSLGACAGAPTDSPDDFGYEGTGIEFTVAPLTLDSLEDACYSFAIYNEQGELVVGRGPGAAAGLGGATLSGNELNTVCASQFGNGDGGDVSYVAPCDAQAPAGVDDANENGINDHTVRLWVDALCTAPVGDKAGLADWAGGEGEICTQLQDYVNPCGAAGCELTVACAENADTPVSFNFTVMGQADQGFFDVAVNFDDVFCSAKMDTCGVDPDGDGPLSASPIRLVFDPVTGQRMDTLVLAVACTAGPGTAVTHLTHKNLSVRCTGGTAPAGGPFVLEGITAEGNQDPADASGLNWAAYFGTESLPNANKVYTNIAVGIPAGATCSVGWDVVPSNGEWQDPGGLNTFNSYGYIQFKDSGIVEGSVSCETNGLNFEGSSVSTQYGTGSFAGEGDAVSQIGLDDQAISSWPDPAP